MNNHSKNWLFTRNTGALLEQTVDIAAWLRRAYLATRP